MKGVAIKTTLTSGLNKESNHIVCIEAIADLSNDKLFFTVHSFKDVFSGKLLPMDEITIRYVVETPVPHWIDEKYNMPSILSQKFGKAIEATALGKEYIALCFLRAMN